MKNDALKTLHTAMLDTREGYEVAERDAETPALKSFFGQMIALRTKDHEAIDRALMQQGEEPDESGSFMATVHKSMARARSLVTGINADALSPFISGEESILEEYENAIREADADNATRDMLVGQREALGSKILEMKAMQASE